MTLATSENSQIAIVILNYNSHEDTLKCIESIKEQENVEYEIIVVDNDSKETDLKSLIEIAENQKVTLLRSASNNGYNAGNNIGIKYALKRGYMFICIVNPDMIFDKSDCLMQLLSAFDDKSVVAVGSDILTPEGHHQNPISFKSDKFSSEFSWIKNVFNTNTNVRKEWNNQPYQVRPCTILNGCCLMIRASFLCEINGFDEKIFLFGEERILGAQIRKLGYKMLYYGKTHAIHNHRQNKEGNQWKRLKLLKKSELRYLYKYSTYTFFQKQLCWISLQVKYFLLFCKYHK